MADAVQKVRILLRVNGTASGVTAKIDPESIQHMQFVEMAATKLQQPALWEVCPLES